MESNRGISRALGIAFLLQFATSIISGTIIRSAWEVPDDIAATMSNIAGNPGLFKINILLDMATALGIVFLGAMLYAALKKQYSMAALVALGFYVLEAGLLAASKFGSYSLLQLSQRYPTATNPMTLETLGDLALQSSDFVGSALHILAFSFGGIIFYYLLYRSGAIPRGLALYGLITLLPLPFGVIADFFGATVPFLLFVPYVPFEFVAGLWILIQGFSISNEEIV
jgi:hypothetical protein